MDSNSKENSNVSQQIVHTTATVCIVTQESKTATL